MGKTREDGDGVWKLILEWFFQPLLEYSFPEISAQIDWSHPPEFLDTELVHLQKQGKGRRQHVDKLVRLRLRGSEESVMILIHIEVQGHKEPRFPLRMLSYYVVLTQRKQERVIQLAILADGDPDWNPSLWMEEGLGMRISYEFSTLKVLSLDAARLAQSDNPAALILLACQKAILSRPRKRSANFSLRLEWKKELTLLSLDKNHQPDVQEKLLLVIDHLMTLPDEQGLQFSDWWNKSVKTNQDRAMVKLYTLESHALKRGRDEGRQEGWIRGQVKGQVALLQRQLVRKFGADSLNRSLVRERLVQPSREDLERWGDRILDARSIEEVFDL